jgi:hypothetical protein
MVPTARRSYSDRVHPAGLCHDLRDRKERVVISRAALGAVGAALAAALLAGCAQAVDGDGRAAGPTGFPSTPRTSAAPSTSAPSTPAGPASSTPAPGTISAAALVGRLMPRPAGSVGWTSSWGRDTSPTLERFVNVEYAAPARAGVLAKLRAQGLTTIAHRTWYAKDSDQADMVLLRFADEAGALSRWLSATGAQAAVTGSSGFDVATVPHSRGFALPHLDQLGNQRVVVYAPVHNVVIELFYYSPATYKPADAQRWLQIQYERLQ